MRKTLIAAAAFGLATLAAAPALAHCDSLDGPVVVAARQALDAKDPAAVLIWVTPENEPAVRAAFHEALAVRKLGPQAKEMADRYFFETLVRLHRAGEGAPYTGLKPAGYDFGPAVKLADEAVATGSDARVAALLQEEVAHGLHARFEDLKRKRGFDAKDVVAGRTYVASYVTFVHYVEGLHRAAAASSAHAEHAGAAEAAERHEH